MEKSKGDFSKKIVAFIIAANVLFALAVFYLFWHTGSEPSTLIGCWFAFTCTELFSLAGIKKKKVENDYTSYVDSIMADNYEGEDFYG